MAKAEGMAYFETSAKHNVNVEEMFSWLAGEMKEKLAAEYIAKYKKTPVYLQSIKTEGKTRNTCC